MAGITDWVNFELFPGAFHALLPSSCSLTVFLSQAPANHDFSKGKLNRVMKAQEKTGPQRGRSAGKAAKANGGLQKHQRVSKKRKAEVEEEPEDEQEQDGGQNGKDGSSDDREKV